MPHDDAHITPGNDSWKAEIYVDNAYVRTFTIPTTGMTEAEAHIAVQQYLTDQHWPTGDPSGWFKQEDGTYSVRLAKY